MTFLWTHEPMLSDEPEELIHHFLHDTEDQIFEAAVFKLKNGKYLFISFSREGTLPDSGISDFEEFDNLNEAAKIFTELTS